jgi:prepilin-type N-terminal cleavage/methylation domain-containing protein
MKKNFFNHKQGFTLVEMLIVIVIIGILASALIPRLSQARERANDTARKAHIQNIATVLIAYQIDRGSYPSTAGPISGIAPQLIGAGLSSVPTDPDANRSFLGIGLSTTTCTASPIGQYMYTPIRKNWISSAGFVLMAGTQTEWGSNFVFDTNQTNNWFAAGCITSDVNFNAIPECPSFIDGPSANLWNCVYNRNQDHLRYIYKQ